MSCRQPAFMLSPDPIENELRPAEKQPWYALRTRSNCERIAASVLVAKGYEAYVPLYSTRRRWSDRVVTTELPLFRSYVFCRFDHGARLPIMTTPGVASVVGFGSDPAPILEAEIEYIRIILSSGLASQPCPFLHEGQKVRITRGSLKNVEGILVRKKTDWRLIVSVTMLQRSVAVEVDHNWIVGV